MNILSRSLGVGGLPCAQVYSANGAHDMVDGLAVTELRGKERLEAEQAAQLRWYKATPYGSIGVGAAACVSCYSDNRPNQST